MHSAAASHNASVVSSSITHSASNLTAVRELAEASHAFTPYRRRHQQRKPPSNSTDAEEQKERKQHSNGHNESRDEEEEEEEQRILLDEQITFLVQNHIRTPEDVLCANVNRWPTQHLIFPRSLMQRLQGILLGTLGRTCVTGIQAWALVKSRTAVSTSSAVIDTLLDGGVQSGEVTEVFGSAASGKTQLCIQLAVSAAASGHRVVVIDTASTFDIKRSQEMLKEQAKKQGKSLSSEQLATIVSHIRICNVFQIFELFPIFDALRKELEANPSSTNGLPTSSSSSKSPIDSAAVDFLIVDSLGGIIAPILAAGNRGLGLMMNAARALKALAADFNISVVTTNYTTASLASNTTPHELRAALGETWLTVADTRLALEEVTTPVVVPSTGSSSTPIVPVSNEKRIRVTLHKSPRKPTGENIVTELGAAGFA